MLENANKGLHTKTGEDDGNPADGSENNGFSTGFDHSDQISFETDSTHFYQKMEQASWPAFSFPSYLGT